MALPVGTFIAPSVQPQQAPVESLDSVIQADRLGTEMGLKAPGTIGAIAQGVGEAVDNYQEQEVTELKKQVLQAQIDRAKAIDPRAVKAAQDARMQQKIQLLGRIVGQGNEQQVTEALTSGAFTDVLQDKDVQRVVFGTAASRGVLNKSIADGFAAQESKRLAKTAEQIGYEKAQQARIKAVEDFKISPVYNNYRAQFPDGNERDLLKYGIAVADGTERDESGKVPLSYGPKGTLKDFNSGIGSETKTFDIIDKRSGKVLATGLSRDEYKQFENAKGAAFALDGSPFKDGPVEEAITKGQQQARRSGVDTFLPDLVTKPVTKPEPVKAQEVARQVKTIDARGNIRVQDDVTAQTALVKAVGLNSLNSDGRYNLEKDVKKLLTFAANPITKQEARDTYTNTFQTVVSTALREQYEQEKGNPVVQSIYNEAAVEDHNKRVQETVQFIEQGANTLPPRSMLNPFELVEVTNPQELYMLKNYGAVAKGLEGYLNTIEKTVRRQNTQLLKTPELKVRLGAVLPGVK